LVLSNQALTGCEVSLRYVHAALPIKPQHGDSSKINIGQDGAEPPPSKADWRFQMWLRPGRTCTAESGAGGYCTGPGSVL